MLYKKNGETALAPELFANPTAEYRGTPFWAWNCRLKKETLLKEIDDLKQMGMGGFHIHSRTGMATEYLSDEFMELVKACDQKAQQEDMLCWLYDEDRWPSGAAGGIVTKDFRWRARSLWLAPAPQEGFEESREVFEKKIAQGEKPQGYFIARYSIHLDENDCLGAYKMLAPGEEGLPEAKTWYAYLKLAEENPWYNNQAYLDTLNPAAVEEFVRVTYDRYFEAVGASFDKSIPAIFTDEPQFTHKPALQFARQEQSIAATYTDDFNDTYKAAYGEEFLPKLPEIVWQKPNGESSVTRYRYHDHVGERFAHAFVDTVGLWCEKHNIAFTGHLMNEPSLHSQTWSVGDAMRCYRNFQLPGIDMLCDRVELTTAKQAQSASRQFGREGVLSELYGVTNWDYDFMRHKTHGDWQAALGITVRVHHLTWVSMEGEAKRDYPASIGYQSPWYKEYPFIEDHFARLNTALTRGKALTRVGVVHPVESYWLHWGPNDQTAQKRGQLENLFSGVTNWLLFNGLDFDFISEALLPTLCEKGSAPLPVGEMAYDVIIVPGCHTLRGTTLERLEAFAAQGGQIIFMGAPAGLEDAMPSERAALLATKATVIPAEEISLLENMEPWRELEIRNRRNGCRTNNFIHQLRQDGENRWLFLCQVYNRSDGREQYLYSQSCEDIQLEIKGRWQVKEYDTLTGQVKAPAYRVENGKTILERRIYSQDSLLLQLLPYTGADGAFGEEAKAEAAQPLPLADSVPVTLSEPNVLLLDMAEYAFDGGSWQAQEELLRIDDQFRDELGWPRRCNRIAQPWVDREQPKAEHTLKLRFTVSSAVSVKGAKLALEHPEDTEIYCNGAKISNAADGWFTDESIRTVPLPDLQQGKNMLEIHMPFHRKTMVEWHYLLGDFGVNVQGRFAELTQPVTHLAYGDFTRQGLPFYAGNVTYHCRFTEEDAGKSRTLQVPEFAGPVLAVSVDGIRKGVIALAPFQIELGQLGRGEHAIDITLYGNRVNAFGTVHNAYHNFFWYGPDAWRTKGTAWTYQYVLRPMGIVQTPIIL